MDRLFRIDFYPQDWLIDTARLDPIDRGIYIQIICLIYSNRGPIVEDAGWIAGVSGTSKTVVKNSLSRLISSGFLTKNEGKIGQKRTENEINLKKNHLENSSKGGKNGGGHNRKNNNLEASDTTKPLASPTPTPTASPSPSPSPKGVSKDTPKGVASISPPEIQMAVSMYNEIARSFGLPEAQKISEARASKIKKRILDLGGLDGWNVLMEKVSQSPFLTGAGERGWKADLDFILQEKSFTRIIEGYYDERKTNDTRKLSVSERADIAVQSALDILNARDEELERERNTQHALGYAGQTEL